MMISAFENKATFYFDDPDADTSFNVINFLFNITLNIVIPVAFILIDFNRINKNRIYIMLLIISLFTYSFSMMLPIMYRINYYFTFFSLMIFIFIFRNIAAYFAPKVKRLCFYILLLSFVGIKGRVYFTISDGIPAYYHYYPYTNIFDEDIIKERETLGPE